MLFAMELFSIHRRLVPLSMVDSVLLHIFNDIRYRGLTREEMDEWYKVNCPFPHLRFIGEILEIRKLIATNLGIQGIDCEPQIIWDFPKGEGWTNPPPHVDQVPPWAVGKSYDKIVGVALTNWLDTCGGLRLFLEGVPYQQTLYAGDVIDFHPELPHAAGINTSGNVRAGLYFRWLQV